MTDLPKSHAIVCPHCGSGDGLVVTGIDVAAILGRYSSADDNRCRWAVHCFGCGKHAGSINDEARDDLFGAGWRSDRSKTDD